MITASRQEWPPLAPWPEGAPFGGSASYNHGLLAEAWQKG